MASITYDNADSVTGTNVSTVTISNFALGSGDNRIVFVGIGVEAEAEVTMSSVQFDSVNMTYLEDITTGVSGYRLSIHVYYMLEAALPSSGNYDIVVTAGASYVNVTAGAISLSEVEQITPSPVSEAVNTTGSPVSTTLTPSKINSWLVDFVGQGNAGAITPTSGQTERFDQAADSSQVAGGTRSVGATVALQTASWSATANRMALVVAAIYPPVSDNSPFFGCTF